MAPNILIFIYIFRYETIETYARAFLALIILAIGTVKYNTAQEKLRPYCPNIYTVMQVPAP